MVRELQLEACVLADPPSGAAPYTYISFRQTNRVVFCRSMLFNTHWICRVAMAVVIAPAVTD